MQYVLAEQHELTLTKNFELVASKMYLGYKKNKKCYKNETYIKT